MNRTRVQFDPDRNHLFGSDQGSAVQCGPWSRGGFDFCLIQKPKGGRCLSATPHPRCVHHFLLQCTACRSLVFTTNKLYYLEVALALEVEQVAPLSVGGSIPGSTCPHTANTDPQTAPSGQASIAWLGVRLPWQPCVFMRKALCRLCTVSAVSPTFTILHSAWNKLSHLKKIT